MVGLLALPLALADEPEPALLVFHVDPAVERVVAGCAAGCASWAGGLTVKAEAPIAWFLVHTVPTAIGALGGKADVDDVLAPAPPISPQYVLFAERGVGPDDPIAWGGGLGLRFRPLAPVGIVPAARGLWLDVNGRYGTRGFGVDAALGWDVNVSPTVQLGPALGIVHDRGGTRAFGAVSVSFGVTGGEVGGNVTLP